MPGRRPLAKIVNRLRHDLAKYIRFQQAWLPDDASVEARRDALIADVLHTRRGPDGSVDAFSLWSEVRPFLFGEQPVDGEPCAWDPRWLGIDAAVVELRQLSPFDGLDEPGLVRAEALCASVSEGIRTIARDLRDALDRGPHG